MAALSYLERQTKTLMYQTPVQCPLHSTPESCLCCMFLTQGRARMDIRMCNWFTWQCNWFTWQCTWNYHDSASQLYSNKIFFKKVMCRFIGWLSRGWSHIWESALSKYPDDFDAGPLQRSLEKYCSKLIFRSQNCTRNSGSFSLHIQELGENRLMLCSRIMINRFSPVETFPIYSNLTLRT